MPEHNEDFEDLEELAQCKRAQYTNNNLLEVKKIQRKVNQNYSGDIRNDFNRLVYLIEEAYEDEQRYVQYYNGRLKKVSE